MALNKVLFDQTIELGLDLSRLSKHTAKTVVDLLQTMERELIARVAAGDYTAIGKTRMDKQIKEAQTVIKRYYDEAAGIAIDTTTQVAQVASTSTAQALSVAVGAQIVAPLLPTATFLTELATNSIIQGAIQADYWAKMSGDTAFKFQAAVRSGLIAAETNGRIVKRVRDVMTVSKRDAETLVRTSVQTVANDAREQSFQDHSDVIKGKEWTSSLDSRTCLICASLDNKAWTLDGKPINHSTPYRRAPVHFNCLTGDSFVTSTDDVTGISKRWFDGEVIVINTAAGRKLTATPNHPILTSSGWVSAGALNVGGDVICDGFSEGRGSGDGNNQNMPATIHDFVKSFLGSRKVSAVPMPTAPSDFHGDGKGSKVAVVYSDSFLGGGFNTSELKHPCENRFIFGLETAISEFFSKGYFFKCFSTRNPTSRSTVGIFNKLRYLFGGTVCHSCKLLLAPVPSSNSLFSKNPVNNSPAFAENFSDASNANSFVKKLSSFFNVDNLFFSGRTYSPCIEPSSESLLLDPDLASELLAGSAGSVTKDYIVNIDAIKFSGHVYNLETVKGWYVANGIITHNCRCSLVPVLRTWRELGVNIDEMKPSTRASMDGSVEDTSFNDWLKRQPTARIEKVMGKGRAELFQAGKLSINDMVDGVRPMTLGELRAKHGI